VKPSGRSRALSIPRYNGSGAQRATPPLFSSLQIPFRGQPRRFYHAELRFRSTATDSPGPRPPRAASGWV